MNSPPSTQTLGNPPIAEDIINHNSPPPDDKLWTTEQVADFLRVSLKTVFNLRKKGLPYVQLGGAVRFIPQEIKDYLSTNRGLSSHRLRQIIRKGATS